MLELAGHYHFAPQPCAVARGNEKGRVERTIRYLRDAFFAARRFTSVADLNAPLTRWIAATAQARPVPGDPTGRRVHEALAEEQTRLLPLPEHPFPCDVVRAVTSGKTPYVRFDGNDYSIPHLLVRQPLTLIASDTLVRLCEGAQDPRRPLRPLRHREPAPPRSRGPRLGARARSALAPLRHPDERPRRR